MFLARTKIPHGKTLDMNYSWIPITRTFFDSPPGAVFTNFSSITHLFRYISKVRVNYREYLHSFRPLFLLWWVSWNCKTQWRGMGNHQDCLNVNSGAKTLNWTWHWSAFVFSQEQRQTGICKWLIHNGKLERYTGPLCVVLFSKKDRNSHLRYLYFSAV